LPRLAIEHALLAALPDPARGGLDAYHATLEFGAGLAAG
jgi:hypothetical protein